jgi:hypothetical protein
VSEDVECQELVRDVGGGDGGSAYWRLHRAADLDDVVAGEAKASERAEEVEGLGS